MLKSRAQTVSRDFLQGVKLADLVQIEALVTQRLEQPEHVLDAGQVDALLAGEELDHPNSPDVVLRIPAPVRRRSLRLDQVLALVDHQRARVKVEDLTRDTWREDRPSRRDRG